MLVHACACVSAHHMCQCMHVQDVHVCVGVDLMQWTYFEGHGFLQMRVKEIVQCRDDEQH